MPEIEFYENLSPFENMVLTSLCQHRGAGNSISRLALVKSAGIDDRKARKIINDLVTTYKYPICSAYDGGGYFIANTAAEIEEAILKLRKHGVHIIDRERALQAALKKYFPQSDLLIEEGA